MSATLPIGPLVLFGESITGIVVPIGSSAIWTFDIEDPITRDPVNLTVTGTAVIMSLCSLDLQGNPAQPPIFSHEADIPGSPTNRCTVEWTPGDTVISGTPLAPGSYYIDVWREDEDGNRLETLGGSIITLRAVATLPGAPVTPSPPTQPLGQGVPGTDGTSFIWLGTYSSLTTYAPNDVVSYESGGLTSTDICILASTNHVPTNATYWELMAEGAEGPTGPQGDPGPTGPAGPSGAGISTTLKTSNYTAVAGDLVRCDPTGGAFNVTLPTGVKDDVIAVKNQSASTNAITILRGGSNTIEGATSLVMAQARQCVVLQFDGTSDWMVI